MRILLLSLLALSFLMAACDNTSLPYELRKIDGHTYIKEWSHDPNCPKCKEKTNG